MDFPRFVMAEVHVVQLLPLFPACKQQKHKEQREQHYGYDNDPLQHG